MHAIINIIIGDNNNNIAYLNKKYNVSMKLIPISLIHLFCVFGFSRGRMRYDGRKLKRFSITVFMK